MVGGEKKKGGGCSPKPFPHLPSPNVPSPCTQRTSQAFNACCRISPWYKAGSRGVALRGRGRERSLKGAPPPYLLLKPGEQWRAVPFRPRAALGHTPTPTSPSQECRAGEAHAGRETEECWQEGRGHLTAHLPDQTGLSSAGREGAMQERRKRRERKKHTYHRGLCSPLLFLT